MTRNWKLSGPTDLDRSPDVPRGWALPMLMNLENMADRRLIGPLAMASAERRSAIFAALAVLRDQAETPATIRNLAPEALVEWLLTATPREIVETCHGAIPALAASVAKTCGDPLDAPADYGRIATILTSTTRRARRQATCLRQSRRITSDYLRSLDLLRDAYLRPGVAEAIGGAAMARQVEQASDVLTRGCLALPDHVLAQSLEQRGVDDLRACAVQRTEPPRPMQTASPLVPSRMRCPSWQGGAGEGDTRCARGKSVNPHRGKSPEKPVQGVGILAQHT